MTLRAFAAAVIALMAVTLSGGPAHAQPYTRITNVANPTLSLDGTGSNIGAATAASGSATAQWEIVAHERGITAERAKSFHGHLRNRQLGQYIWIDPRGGNPSLFRWTQDQINLSAWIIRAPNPFLPYYEIQSATADSYLQVRNGVLTLGPRTPGDTAALWMLDRGVLAQAGAKFSIKRAQVDAQQAQVDAAAAAAAAQAQRKDAQARHDNPHIFQDSPAQNPSSTRPNGSVLLGSLSDKGGRPQPRAYEVSIDFCHSDLQDTGTANELIVTLSGADGVVGTQRVQGTGSCSVFGAPVSADRKVSFATFLDVSAIEIETTGGDALFIDEIEIWSEGKKIAWYGRDNLGGWCLSTDANDHIGGWEKAVQGCTKSMKSSGRL